MNCLTCAHIDLRTFPAHAKVGVSRCKLQPLPGVFENFRRERDCKLFAAADAETVAKRNEWANK